MKNIIVVLILFFGTFAWSQDHILSDAAKRETHRLDRIDILKKDFIFRKQLKDKFPKNDYTENMESLGSKILQFEIAHKRATVINNKRAEEIYMDFESDQCKKGYKSRCDGLVRDQAKYKQDYKTDYTIKEIIYPQIDLENMTYTMPNGLVYDLNKGAVIKEVTQASVQVVTPSSSDPTKVDEKKVEAPVERVQYDDEVAAKTSEDKICEWDDSKSKRSLSGLNCEEKVCSSWVICTKNGRKSRALASCSMDLCVDGKASECVAQKGYGSIKLNFKSSTASGAKSPVNKQKTQN